MADKADLLDRLIALLDEHAIAYCIIGGQAVNAYVDPVVSLDLDIVVAVEQLPHLRPYLEAAFAVEEFPHSLNISLTGSDLRVQIQKDPRYASFVERSERRNVLGVPLPVAALNDLLQGKVWAATDSSWRPSKRQKDLADIARLIESYPALRERVPAAVLDRLV